MLSVQNILSTKPPCFWRSMWMTPYRYWYIYFRTALYKTNSPFYYFKSCKICDRQIFQLKFLNWSGCFTNKLLSTKPSLDLLILLQKHNLPFVTFNNGQGFDVPFKDRQFISQQNTSNYSKNAKVFHKTFKNPLMFKILCKKKFSN